MYYLCQQTCSGNIICGSPPSYTLHGATLTLTFDPLTFRAKTGTPVTPALEKVQTNFGHSTPFLFFS